MDFTGRINYYRPSLDYSKGVTWKDGIGIKVMVNDARKTYGVLEIDGTQENTTDILLNGPGFLLVKHASAVHNWADQMDVCKHYYKEAEKLMLSLLPPGTTCTKLMSHTYRCEDNNDHTWNKGVQHGPVVHAVHNDYGDDFTEDWRTVTRKFSDIMGFPSDKRVVGFNIWRSTTKTPLERNPLIVCNRLSIDAFNDLEYSINVNGKGAKFNSISSKPSDRHEWNYYSSMAIDEALVFTTYDSHPDEGPIFCPTLHTSIDIPGSENKIRRESVEVRLFCFLPLPNNHTKDQSSKL